jgi:hypothetical protein
MVFGSALHIVIPRFSHYYIRPLRDNRKYNTELISYNCESGAKTEIWIIGLH